MSTSTRWSLVALVAVVGIVVALLSTMREPSTVGPDGRQTGVSSVAAPPAGAPPVNEPATTADPAARAAARLPACRDRAAAATTTGPLAGFPVTCMDDGSTTTLGKIQAGRPMLVNLWAYWCEPCRRELPALQAAQRTLGDRALVVLSHTDPSETKGLETLRALGIEQVAVSDPEEQLPHVLGAPPVLPVSVLVRPDGSVAKILLQPMTSEREVLDAVAENLGVRA